MTTRADRDRPSRLAPRALVPAALLVGLAACAPPEQPALHGEGEGGAAWISGTVNERFQQVGDQFAGFSATMFEVAHRYRELHWAIEDDNRAYARYQTEKIRDAIELGIIRRPGRAESARALFLGAPVEELLHAIEEGDDEALRREFGEFTAACNQCHVAEDMAFVMVGAPPERSSVVLPPSNER